jgi:hypothetical protein
VTSEQRDFPQYWLSSSARQNVHEITTGENAGYFWVDLAGGIQRVPFHPHETLLEAHAELLALRIVRT